jgi:hypothetical protein
MVAIAEFGLFKEMKKCIAAEALGDMAISTVPHLRI